MGADFGLAELRLRVVALRNASRRRGIYGGSEDPSGVSPECLAAEQLAFF